MGIAKIQYSVSTVPSLTSGKNGIDSQSLVQIFSSLPKNTSLVGMKTLPITSISITYELEVENELFRDGSEIDVLYIRQIGRKDDGSLEQFNIFQGLDLKDALDKSKTSSPTNPGSGYSVPGGNITPLAQAVDVLKNALKNDKSYEDTWQANIAMAFKDEFNRRKPIKDGDIHDIANDAAQNFLNNLKR